MKSIYMLLLLGLSLANQLIAQTSGLHQESAILPDTNTKITLKSAFENLGSWGHYPLNVTLRNTSDKSQTFQLDTVSSSEAAGYRGSKTKEIKTSGKFSFTCPAGIEKSFSVLIPLAMASYGANDYSWSRHSNNDEKSNLLLLKFTSGNDIFTSSISGNHIELKSYAVSLGFSQKIPYSSKKRHLLEATTVDLLTLPLSQQSLVGYDTIFLLYEDWEKLSKDRKKTLITWTQRGGNLTILVDILMKNQIKELQNFFPGIDPSLLPVQAPCINGHVFIGTKKQITAKLAKQPPLPIQKISLKTLKHNFTNHWPLQEQVGSKEFGVVPIIILLIIFASLVGPLNFFVFAKQGKRHKLFLTTPLIALSMSAVLVCFIVFKDGFGGNGKRVLLKEIDAQSNTSYSIQEQFCRTGMLFGDKFELPNGLFINQVPISKSRWARVSNEKQNVKEDYTIIKGEATSSYLGNYFSSRSEHGHLVTGEQITQESITITPKAGGFEVISTLKESLDSLYFVKDSSYYLVTNLTTGNPAIAQLSNYSEWEKWVNTQCRRFAPTAMGMLRHRSTREDSFIAFSSNAVGIDTHPSIKWGTEAIITGVLTTNTSQ